MFRDADETISWINEKDTLLSTDDYGRDLPTVQALQRKHDGLERDLNALEDKVRFHTLFSIPSTICNFVYTYYVFLTCIRKRPMISRC